jgi:hypothetical protein
LKASIEQLVLAFFDMPTLDSYSVGMQYTLRKVPREVDKALRRKAKLEGKSLNQVAVEALAKGANIDQPRQEFRNLDFAIGTWVEDPEFDKIIQEQRQIDPELWK